MEEKSIEELQAELEALKKANLEMELAKEKAKAEEAERLKKEKEIEAMREEIRQEILSEINTDSKITSDEPTKLDSPTNEFEEFKAVFTKKLGITGEPYESFVKKLAFKEYAR